MLNRAMTLVFFAAVGVVAIGCGGGPLDIRVRGVEPLNVNEKGESTPIDVRIYTLKDNAKFEKALFEDLWTKDKEVLGDNMIGEPKQITINPGKADAQARVEQLGVLPPEVRYIGIMALYSKGKGEQRHIAVARDQADDYIFEFTEYKVKFKP